MRINESLWEKSYKDNDSNSDYLVYPDEELVRLVKRAQKNMSIKNVLDIGSGSGRHSVFLATEGFNVKAMDSSETSGMILKKIYKNGKGLIKFKKASITALPFNDSSFDLVVCWGILHYLSENEQNKALREIYRVMKDNGLFLLTLRSKEDSAYNIKNHSRWQESFAEDSRRMRICYFDRKEVLNFMKRFKNLKIGHKTRTLIDNPNRLIAHFFISASKASK